jgi:hypothetical protein
MNNELIKCSSCGNIVDVTGRGLGSFNAPKGFKDAVCWNPLVICDRLAECCDNPDYHHIN